MTSIVQMVRDLIRDHHREAVFRAVVTGTSGNLVTVKRTGQTNADTQSYPALVSYSSPTADDEVLVVRVGDGYVVVGEITR